MKTTTTLKQTTSSLRTREAQCGFVRVDRAIQKVKKANPINFTYAFFMVFVTPISIPLAYYTVTQHLVTTAILITTLISYLLTGFGIAIGYHRLATHQSFKTHAIIKYLLLILGAMSMQGPPAAWASLHIQHHARSDRLGDTHSPSQGFWYSHCGWIFHGFRPNLRKYGKWLLKDKPVMHVSRYYHYYVLLGLIISLVTLGWVGLVWAGLLRVFVVSHATWAVNSIAHKWGARPYPEAGDNSRNNFWVALVSLGEGWHNNHHRFMQSPYFGLKWHQIDPSGWVIKLMAKVGLAWDLKLPNLKKKHN